MPTELGPVVTTLKQKSTEFHSQALLKATKQNNLIVKNKKNKQVLTVRYVKLAFSFFHNNLHTAEVIFSIFFWFLCA